MDTFIATIDTYGPPASTLTDNGRVYTARHGGGRNEFEYVLAALNIRQKNGAPNHPQTQGKICEDLSWCCVGLSLTPAKV